MFIASRIIKLFQGAANSGKLAASFQFFNEDLGQCLLNFFRVYDLKCSYLAEFALTALSYFYLWRIWCRKHSKTPLKSPVTAEDQARTKENKHINFYLDPDPDYVNVFPVFLLRRAVCEVHPFSALSCLWHELTT